MKSVPRRYGTQEERRASARKKLLDATVALVGERGQLGFAIAEVEERAGVGRALALYHFKTRDGLLQAVAASVLDDEAGPGERGLKPMLAWMDAQLQRAAAGEPRLAAALEFAVGGGAETVTVMRAEYWRRHTALLLQHLTSARTLGQLRDRLDPVDLAPVVLGQLHGELLRIIATGRPASPAFLDLLEYALSLRAEPAKAIGKPRTGKRAGDVQPGLF